MILRLLEKRVQRWLGQFPAVAILGPRQCGKSTLAQRVLAASLMHCCWIWSGRPIWRGCGMPRHSLQPTQGAGVPG